MARKKAAEDSTTRELSDIKKLLVLKLLRDGATQSEVAAALGVSRRSVNRMFPSGFSVSKSNTAK